MGAARAAAPLPSDLSQGHPEGGPHSPSVEPRDVREASGSVGGGGCEARWGVDGCCGGDQHAALTWGSPGAVGTGRPGGRLGGSRHSR